ncbi:LLM class flavin-dependent oxidoreductase [Nocardioides massiliensis]|uniref:Alkanesulfonate monooxygenase SsuD/methylene tetrahydromethanopterin reductase-like flavin-dependent oxidoreductase (Luciferase family) n=1 Tax=Nocardioides massiliensis TaxID=1325935 RepID=A0ABT9NQ30_9ACTN|nr:LLM class flavin-dependent oxidoreductase [Nocardioides massiliensis]MDP9822284.1 alkanesulfonate monooxygenase SsuD/methylene tetrahydromethanopterin reductase-like flavin-dependent oxidoreductase (luciferase family) [Nocardioides massiliensis]
MAGRMDVGMTLPVMEPALDADILEAWARATDEGPWSSIAFGERVVFDNPETLTLLGAVAAWTSRVRVVTTVLIPQLHDPVFLAKAIATGDLLTRGRLTVGVGVGGREEDYRAVGADPATQTRAEMARRVNVMRRIWSGEPQWTVESDDRRVGPPPVQDGGPPLLIGAVGPKSIRSASAWADGIAGITMDLDLTALERTFDQVRTAWADASRPVPQLTTSFWFALDDGDGSAREQVNAHLRHYFTWLPADLVEAMIPGLGFAGTPAQLRETLDRIADLGCDEVQLVPTSSDITQVHRAAEVVGAASR